MVNPIPDVAYYYPAPFWGWQEGGWAKTLLLFFDRISILLPDYMRGRHTAADPTLVIPLEDRGLLDILEPSDWVDQTMTEQLAEVMVELITNGAFDDVPEPTHFRELSMSRTGYSADVELANMLVEELASRGLARPSEDGVSVPLHPTVRTTILVILGQLSRTAGARRKLAIHPATNNVQAINDLLGALTRDPMPSAGRVINLDLQQVSFDLDPVPLDDLLEFREEHQDAHKAYIRNLHGFMTELARIDEPGDREALLLERQQEIDDAAHSLRRATRRSLSKNLTGFSLGLAGAGWSIATGDPLGALLGTAGLAVTLTPDLPDEVSAYSYIFAAQRRLGHA